MANQSPIEDMNGAIYEILQTATTITKPSERKRDNLAKGGRKGGQIIIEMEGIGATIVRERI